MVDAAADGRERGIARFGVDAFLVGSPVTAEAVAAAAETLGASGVAHPIDGPGIGIHLDVAMRDDVVVGTGLETAGFAAALRAALDAASVEWTSGDDVRTVDAPEWRPGAPRALERSIAVLPATLEPLGLRTSLPRSGDGDAVARVDVDGRTVLVADGGWPASWSLASRPVVGIELGPDGVDLAVWTRSGHSTGRRNAWRSAAPDLARTWPRVVELGDPSVARPVRDRIHAALADPPSRCSASPRESPTLPVPVPIERWWGRSRSARDGAAISDERPRVLG